MTGPAASDGPWFVAVSTTAPLVPGTMVGVETLSARSARAGPATTVADAVLSAGDGSLEVVVADALPPAIGPGGVEDASLTGSVTVTAAPSATGPATTHVTLVPVPLQPFGSVPTITDAGGVYVNVVGPAASDGPLFVAVIVTVPAVPGVTVGLVTLTAMSATRGPTMILAGLTVLFAGAGSVEAAATLAEPASVCGASNAGTDTGRSIEIEAEAASVEPNPHVIVVVPEQPVGRVATVTPAGST